MTKLEVSFVVGEKVIDSVNIRQLTFVQFADLITKAWGMKAPSSIDGRIRRLRMEQQVEYLSADKPVALAIDEILRIPLLAARKINKNLMNGEDSVPVGKIIREGDGISNAIAFELGTPIEVANGKEPITELEFIAKTYGDIEDVLAANDGLSQTIALIRTVAKPVHSSLMSLPSWAIDKITVADGMTIASVVTTRFLDDQQEDDIVN